MSFRWERGNPGPQISLAGPDLVLPALPDAYVSPPRPGTPTPKRCGLATSLQSSHLLSLGPCAEFPRGSGLAGGKKGTDAQTGIRFLFRSGGTISQSYREHWRRDRTLVASAESWAQKERVKIGVSLTIMSITAVLLEFPKLPCTIAKTGIDPSALACRHPRGAC